MAQKKSGFTGDLPAHVKTSNTGHAEHPAKRAPMSSKDSVLLGGEQTSDGASAEKKARRTEGKDKKYGGEKTSHLRKTVNASLKNALR
jgi:hypothetical protein